MEQFFDYLGKFEGQFFGVTGWIKTFFGGLADLNTAPVYAASGAEGVYSGIVAIIKSVAGLFTTVSGAAE